MIDLNYHDLSHWWTYSMHMSEQMVRQTGTSMTTPYWKVLSGKFENRTFNGIESDDSTAWAS